MSFEPYRDMFFYLPFSTYTVNSLVVAGAATTLTLIMGSLAAFAFARFSFSGKSARITPLPALADAPGRFGDHAAVSAGDRGGAVRHLSVSSSFTRRSSFRS